MQTAKEKERNFKLFIRMASRKPRITSFAVMFSPPLTVKAGPVCPLRLGRRTALLLSGLDAPKQPRHVPAQVPHGLEALLVLLHQLRGGAKDHAPVGGGHNGHFRIQQILVQHIQRGGGPGTAGRRHNGGGLVAECLRSGVKGPVQQGQDLSAGMGVVDRRAKLDLMEKTKAELASSSDNISGEVYIGGGETDAISLLAQTAGKLQEKYPLIHYHIYSGDAEIVMEKLDKGLIDFGLLVGPADVRKYEYMRLPISDIWGVLMRKDSPLAEKETICAQDLWDKPLIVSHQTSISGDMMAWLKKDVSKLNIVMTYDLIFNASLFVKKGIGYAIALDKIINTTGDSELCFRPLSPTLEAGLCIVWKKYQVFSKASKEFLRLLKSGWEGNPNPNEGAD